MLMVLKYGVRMRNIIIRANGTQEWWKDGERHRDGGLPAYIGVSGDQEWWNHGNFIF